MAYKLGIDLIEKERFAGLVGRPGLARRFSAAELAFAQQTARTQEALAAAFAAKEAFFKAVSGVLADTSGIFWQAELLHSPNGRPYISLPPDLQARLAAQGIKNIEVAITHNRTTVLAVVLLSSDTAAAAPLPAEVIPPGFVDFAAGALCPVDGRLAASWLPLRSKTAHKGSFGHVAVLGGSALYPGAPQMSALAALSAGAGLVTLAVPQSVPSPTPEVIRHAVDGQACLTVAAADELCALCADKTPVIGMGMGRAADTVNLCARLFALPQPKVIDADGLFALAQLGMQPVNAILTPHEGELARLLGSTAAEVAADRLTAARLAARRYASIVVLKGAQTLTVSPDGTEFVNTCGNPGMATGGSGDVLAGIIGAWLAQGMQPVQAAAFGVYLHGLAGDIAAAQKTQYAMRALDIVHYLPQAYKQLLDIKGNFGGEFQ